MSKEINETTKLKDQNESNEQASQNKLIKTKMYLKKKTPHYIMIPNIEHYLIILVDKFQN